MMTIEKVKSPIVKVHTRKKIDDDCYLYWFAVNGKLTFPSITGSRDKPNEEMYFTFWNGNKCISISGLKATKEFIKTHTVIRTFEDGSWNYFYQLNI